MSDGIEGTARVVVTGHLLVDPERREAYLADCEQGVRLARAAEGCLDFAISADLLDPARIDVVEVWASAEALAAFRGSGPDGEQQEQLRGGSVLEHDVTSTRRLL